MMHPTIAQALAPFTPPPPTVADLQVQIDELKEEMGFYLAPFAPPAPTVEELQAQINDLKEEMGFYLEALNYIYDGIENHSIWHVNQVRGVCARVLP